VGVGVRTPRRSTAVRYELLDRIAGGAHGEVWRARGDDGSIVAVKLLGGPGVTKESRLRFFQEQAFRFDHPNIAGPRGVAEFDGVQALVMDLVDGTDLRGFADANGGTLPDAVLLCVARDALAALAYLHERAIVHRDISPGNLLVTSSGGALVTRVGDFGTALDLDGGRLTAVPGVVVGTHGYSAPELYSGAEATPRSDLWSLGSTLRSVRSDGDHADATSHALDELITRLCAEDPADRPVSALEARAIVPDADTITDATATVPRLAPLPRRRRATITAVCAVLLVAAVGTGIAVRLHRRSTAPPTTWQRVVDATIRTGYDSSTVRTSTGRVLVAHTDFTDGHLLLTICDDGACTKPRTRVVDPGRRSGYYPEIALDRDEHPVLVYQDSARHRLVVRRCHDPICETSTVDEVPLPTPLRALLRSTFTADNPTPSVGEVSLRPQLVVNGTHLSVTYDNAQTNHVAFAHAACTPEACRWHTTDLGDGGGSALTLLPDGRPVIAGTSRITFANAIPALTGALWFTVCNDEACTQHRRVQTAVLAQAPALTTTRTGVVAATSIYDTAVGPNAIYVTSLRLTGCAPATCRTVETHRISVGSQAEEPAVALSDAGLVVAYKVSNAAAPGLAWTLCPDQTCAHPRREALANATPADAVPSSGHDPSIAVHGDDIWVSHSKLPPSTGSAGRLVVFHTRVG